jgi:DNA-directed RNA polymerase specialized sigma24 family protein
VAEEVFRILANIAATRTGRDSRSVPFSSLADDEVPALDPDRFLPPDHPTFPGRWALGPTAWASPEEGLLAGETREVILSTIRELSDSQRSVITLRDVDGRSSSEVRAGLSISATAQHARLNRGRDRVRGALERYYDAVERTVQPVG